MLDVWLTLYDNGLCICFCEGKRCACPVSDQQVRRELLFLQYIADFGHLNFAFQPDEGFSKLIESDLVTGKYFLILVRISLAFVARTPALLFDFQKRIFRMKRIRTKPSPNGCKSDILFKDNAERLSKTRPQRISDQNRRIKK